LADRTVAQFPDNLHEALLRFGKRNGLFASQSKPPSLKT
jgi:hypothetical protein